MTQSLELKDMINRMQRTLRTKVSLLGNDHKGRIFPVKSLRNRKEDNIDLGRRKDV